MFDILEPFVRLQLPYHWMQRMTRELFLKAQARHVLQSFLNHQKEPAYSQCCHICVNWPQQTGATSVSARRETYDRCCVAMTGLSVILEAVQADLVASGRS